MAVDTIIVWWSKNYYSTNLLHYTPVSAEDSVKNYFQVSLVIVTPPRLIRQWKKLQKEGILFKQAEDLVVGNGHVIVL